MVEPSSAERRGSSELASNRIDALVVLGIGGNIQLKGPKRNPRIENAQMRLNTLAANEVAGHLPPGALIIPTGKGTEVVDWHIERLAKKKNILSQAADPNNAHELRDALPSDTSYLEFQDFMGQPRDEAELARTAKEASQGRLMTELIRNARAKSGGGLVSQEILPETRARTTILNLIETLNLLDARARGVWEGNIAILTTNTGHLQRAQESAHALGLTNVRMLSSEQVLLSKGYDPEYLQKMLQMSKSDFKEQEKNYRAIKELPEYLIPEVVFIQNDQRLRQVMTHFETYYRIDALKKYGVENHRDLSADEIRQKISAVGIGRTRALLAASFDTDLKELGIGHLDQNRQFEEIRSVLSSGVGPAEITRRILLQRYGEDEKWLAENDMTDLATTKWYRIKNWFFGRTLPPDDRGDTAVPDQWLSENKMYNEKTKAWLSATSYENLTT